MPVAILSLRFSPLLDSCFIKREPWLPWKHLPERVNWQCTRVSTLSERCQYERYLLQSVMTLFNMMLGVICPRECFSASLTLCSYEHISGLSIVTGKIVQKRICRLSLKRERLSLVRLVCLKKPRLGGFLPVEALDQRQTLTSWPFHGSPFCKVSPFVSHWTSEESGGTHHWGKLFTLFFFLLLFLYSPLPFLLTF